MNLPLGTCSSKERLENDADLKKLQEELRRERERVEKLEKEVKERMRQQLQNSGARRQGR